MCVKYWLQLQMLDILYLTVGVYPPANKSRKGVTATDGTMCKLADVTHCFVEVPEKLLRFSSTECIFRKIDGNIAHICCLFKRANLWKYFVLISQAHFLHVNLTAVQQVWNHFPVYSCPYNSKENMQWQHWVTLSSGVSPVLLRGLLSPFLWWYVD